MDIGSIEKVLHSVGKFFQKYGILRVHNIFT